MTRARRFFHVLSSQAGLVIVLGLLTVGLTGCYTQLETVDRSAQGGEKRAQKQTAQKQTPSDTRASEEPAYADEYRREYRQDSYDDGVGVAYDNGGY